MHNVVKWRNILKKPCGVNTARFLKYVWPFYNIMHERVKSLFSNVSLNQVTNVSAQTFSRDCGRLNRTYLFKFVRITLRVPIKCKHCKNFPKVISQISQERKFLSYWYSPIDQNSRNLGKLVPQGFALDKIDIFKVIF